MTLAVSGPDALAGRTLGDYVVREKLGEGGFGAVYRAEQPLLEREAVIKVLHTRLRTTDEATQRFLREAKLASRLDHPYAAHVYAFGAEPDGLIWIAMELVRGVPLDKLLRQQGPLPLERFVPLFERICEVVETAHEAGLVHRDLKPANVMVISRAGRLLPKLLDFGIAKAMEQSAPSEPLGELAVAATQTPAGAATDDTLLPSASLDTRRSSLTPRSSGERASLTREGAIMGSPPYMAPEQWIDAASADARTDLYALGIMAFECLTGKPPFRGSSLKDIALAHATSPVPPLGPGLPGALHAFLTRALAKQPDARFPSALELGRACRAASGLVDERPALPRLPSEVRDAALTSAPQPIAEAVAALEARHTAPELRDGLFQLAGVVVRWLAIVGLAAASRRGTPPEPARELLRELHKRPLGDAEWLALARALLAPHAAAAQVFPLPELVGFFFTADGSAAPGACRLDELLAQRAATASGVGVAAPIEELCAATGRLLEALAFLHDYPLAAPRGAGRGEAWMGVRRTPRAALDVMHRDVQPGQPVLLDRDGSPIVLLHPLVQLAPAVPGAADELFVFDGRGPRGARLVALPAGFERGDDGLWDWLRAQLPDLADAAASSSIDQRSPYRGLAAFTADDAAFFVGRERLLDVAANRLRAQPLLAVVGPSGAGKSSFVHAGLLPALPSGTRSISFRPGGAPMSALAAWLHAAGVARGDAHAWRDRPEVLRAAVVADARERGKLVIVVDQFEEVLTLCLDGTERAAFARALAALATSADDPVRVVLTLRDDFLVRAESLPALRERLAQSLLLVTPPSPDEMVRMLVEPARRAGFDFDNPGLPARMVAEVADQPGALPLLSFTAAQLWEQRDRHFRQLLTRAYESLGGVGGALAAHAEKVLADLPAEHRRLVREAFRHLVTVEGTRATRSRAELVQLLGGSAHAGAVLERLVGARLLVASESEAGGVHGERLEVVHEALLTAWPRLVEWRRDDAEATRRHDQLRVAVRTWADQGRAAALLWRDDVLAELERWLAHDRPALTDDEQAFVAASRSEAARGKRLRRRLLTGAVTVLSIGLLAVTVLLFQVRTQKREADTQRGRAEEQSALAVQRADEVRRTLAEQYRERGRQLLLANSPSEAYVFLVEAAKLGMDDPALRFMLAQAWRPHAARVATMTHGAQVESVVALPDGRVITGDAGGEVRVWSALGVPLRGLPHRAKNPIVELQLDGEARRALAVSFAELVVYQLDSADVRFEHALASPRVCSGMTADGELIVASTAEATEIWDLRRESHLSVPIEPGQAPLLSCAVRPDGKQLVRIHRDGTMTAFDPRTGRAPRFVVRTLAGVEVAYSPDGNSVVAYDMGTQVVIVDVASGRIRRLDGHVDRVAGAAWSPDGKWIATISTDRTARIWTAESATVAAVLQSHGAALRAVRFDAASRRLATGDAAGSVFVWSVPSGRLHAVLPGHASDVTALDFAGDRLVSASWDQAAVVWKPDLATPLVHEHLAHEAGSQTVVASATGNRVVTAGMDGATIIWDGATARSRLQSEAPVPSVALSEATDALAIADLAGNVRVVDIASGQTRFARAAGKDQPWSVSFDARGEHLAVCYLEHVDVLSGSTGALEKSFSVGGNIGFATLDGAGARLLVGRESGAGVIFEVGGPGRVDLEGAATGFAGGGAFSADGTMVVTAHATGAAHVWDASSGAHLSELSGGHTGFIWTAKFTHGGAFVVTVGADGTARIWDVKRRAEIGRLHAHRGMVGNPAVRDDREQLITIGEDGWMRVWDLAPDRASLEDWSKRSRCVGEVQDGQFTRSAKCTDG